MAALRHATKATVKNSARMYANSQSISAAKGTIAATSGVEYLTPPYERKTIMLYTIAIVLVILWLLGLYCCYERN